MQRVEATVCEHDSLTALFLFSELIPQALS
jgi:hypothetical protein